MNAQIAEEMNLCSAHEEMIDTAAGMVKMRTFSAAIELPVGLYDMTVASCEVQVATLPNLAGQEHLGPGRSIRTGQKQSCVRQRSLDH